MSSKPQAKYTKCVVLRGGWTQVYNPDHVYMEMYGDKEDVEFSYVPVTIYKINMSFESSSLVHSRYRVICSQTLPFCGGIILLMKPADTSQHQHLAKSITLHIFSGFS